MMREKEPMKLSKPRDARQYFRHARTPVIVLLHKENAPETRRKTVFPGLLRMRLF